MKHIFLFLAVILIVSCKNVPPETTTVDKTPQIEYPAELVKIFDNHGGLDKWNSMKSMSYEIVKEEGNEKQFIDLHDRRERIEASNFTSGYDGKEYWIEADTTYKGNAKFYTNLIFYFYAMPFVLADAGINYEKTEPIEFEGESYPGYRISYGDGVGVSPEDEYFIHYDSETNEMAWLGYTVTFFSGKKSEKRSYIRYNDWKNFNGVKSPNSLTWFTIEEEKLIEPSHTINFEKAMVSETQFTDAKFAKSNGAKVVE
ncbi:MAG: hypothetical protein ACI86M_000812 [Saprospiraceae bacterium]|jgi:hypothetical protein